MEPWIEALWSAVSKESQSKKAETFKPNSAKTDMDDNGKYQIDTKDGEKVKDKVDKDVSERDQSNLNGVATDEERWNSPSKELNGKGFRVTNSYHMLSVILKNKFLLAIICTSVWLSVLTDEGGVLYLNHTCIFQFSFIF